MTVALPAVLILIDRIPDSFAAGANLSTLSNFASLAGDASTNGRREAIVMPAGLRYLWLGMWRPRRYRHP
jgi:hypothetical protein